MADAAATPGTLRAAVDGDCLVLAAAGSWTIGAAGQLSAALAAQTARAVKSARVDLSRVAALDTAGAWLIHQTGKKLRDRGIPVEVVGANAAQTKLLDRLKDGEHATALERPAVNSF